MEISIANQAGAFRKEIQRLRWQLADEEEKMKKVAEEVLEELPMTPRSSNPATPRSNHAATPRSFKKHWGRGLEVVHKARTHSLIALQTLFHQPGYVTDSKNVPHSRGEEKADHWVKNFQLAGVRHVHVTLVGRYISCSISPRDSSWRRLDSEDEDYSKNQASPSPHSLSMLLEYVV
jgi:hypothetical protein